MAEFKMQIVNGVRYRPEDAPKQATEEKAATPKNKARKAVSNKAASGSSSEE